jgi:hypothetical protein
MTLTRLGDVVAAVSGDLSGVPIDAAEDRHVAFLRRHATVARDQHARSIAVEMDAIADRLELAVRARRIPIVFDPKEGRNRV